MVIPILFGSIAIIDSYPPMKYSGTMAAQEQPNPSNLIGGYITFSSQLPPDLTFMSFMTNSHGHYSPVRIANLKRDGVRPFPNPSPGRRFIHSGYVTVPSSEKPNTMEASLTDIVLSSEIANWIGYEGIVVHLPRCYHYSPRFAIGYRRALDLCMPPCKLLFENEVGCPMPYRPPMEILKDTAVEIQKMLASPFTYPIEDKSGKTVNRVIPPEPNPERKWAFCIDTCHLFAAGQPLTTEEDARKYIELEKQIPVGLIHLNGSIYDYMSNKDEHCRTASHRDKIWGRDNSGLRILVRHWLDNNIPMILERKGFNQPEHYKDEIEELYKLVA